MFKTYFKTAWRSLGKNKTHSFINIAGLSIGMAVAILIGLWMYDELSFNKNFKHYDRIAQVIQNVTNNGEVQTWTSVPYPLADELRKNYGSDFKRIVMGANWGDHILTVGDKKIKATGGYFEKEMPDLFTLDMLQGSRNGLVIPASVLISESAASAYFGTANAIDKIVQIDANPIVKVTGVYKDFPRNSALFGLNFISSWDFIYSNDQGLRTMDDPWRPNFTTIFVELNDHASFANASAKIRDAKLKKVNPQLAKKKPALFLQPMSNWHLYAEFKNGKNTGGAIEYVWMFGIIGAFVLLLACINFMNLSTARSEKRAKEVGIRKTVGSLRRQLIEQFFAESIFTVSFAFLLSLLWVQLTLPFFNEVAGKKMSVLWASPVFWLLSVGFILITSLVAGSYPAFYLSSFNPIKVLKGTFKAGRLAAIPRKVLVVLQFTVSVSLIIGTIIVYQQIQFAKNRPVGYSRNELVVVPTMNEDVHTHFNAVKQDLLQSGFITSIAETQSPTTAIWNSTSGFSWPEKDPNLSVDFAAVMAGYDFGKTIGWKIKTGRDFSREFATDSAALILNEAAVRFMNLKNPVGTNVSWWGQPYTVIGVVDNMIVESPYEEPRPTIYGLSGEAGNLAIMKINPAKSASAAIAKIEAVFKANNPLQPFEYQFVDSEYAKKFGDEERIGKLASFFALLAILISSLGLFGLTSFVAEQRKREIGIRKVLGASVFSVWNLLSKDFLVLVIISFLLAAPLAWIGMHKWLLSYTYRINIGWEIFAIAGSGAMLIALLTVSFQSVRAALSNPVKSLKVE